MNFRIEVVGGITVTHRLDVPQISQLGGAIMAKFDDLMTAINDVKSSFDAFEERETAEDTEKDALKARITELEGQLETASASALTDDQVATLQGELAALKARADAQDAG